MQNPFVSGPAMIFEGVGRPLRQVERGLAEPGPGQVLVRVSHCGVCRSDLHLIDGELPNPKLPVVPGHEIIGTVVAGDAAKGERVGIPWLGWTCGECVWCLQGRENLCEQARFTGYTLDGGYAAYAMADSRYCFPIPSGYSDAEAAPLLCAGLIGYRCLGMCKEAKRVGIYGFGAAAHIVTQLALYQQREIYAFTREGDTKAQQFALELGAVWAGSSQTPPPVALDAAILFAPVGELVPLALRAVTRGGTVVCGGIHMSPIPSFSYDLLWEERVLRSVANLTRRDALEFLKLAVLANVKTRVTVMPLAEANAALERLRHGQIEGALVLSV
jgi:propanol-preferring alcohol dehydrogenase